VRSGQSCTRLKGEQAVDPALKERMQREARLAIEGECVAEGGHKRIVRRCTEACLDDIAIEHRLSRFALGPALVGS
jgi:hypothetical protein